jgi:Zn-dependent M16 (insulinase) family peptidase
MKTTDSIRNELIDKILSIRNTDFLKALDKLVATSTQADTISITNEQREMLEMSENDISVGRLISHDELDSEDREWLKRK